jgi:putative oxidoreductase
MFIYSGIAKVIGFSGTEKMMRHYGFPLTRFALVGALCLELFGGLLLLIGVEVKVTAAALSVFVVLASIMVPVKQLGSPEKRTEAVRTLFTNLALIGGLICLFAKFA